MKKLQHLQTFESYIASKQEQDELNEANFKTLALAGLMGASALSVSGAGNKGKNDGEKDRIEFTTTNPTTARTKIEKGGFILDSISVIKELTKIPSKIIDTIHYTIPIANDFESSKFELSQNTKDSISKAFSDIESNSYNVLYMNVVSSSDATPISFRMTQATGIKNNIELSLKRSSAVSNYLRKSFGVDSCSINIEKPIVGNKPDSEKDRYVTLEIVTTKITEETKAGLDKEETTYYLSKEKGDIGTKKKSHYFTKEVKKSNKLDIIRDIKAIPCSKN